MNARTKDIIIRALKTFIQAAVGYIVAALVGKDVFSANTDANFWSGLIVAAVAAGCSAAWNAVIKPALPPDPTKPTE